MIIIFILLDATTNGVHSALHAITYSDCLHVNLWINPNRVPTTNFEQWHYIRFTEVKYMLH